jgi:hypothetical protein
MLKEDNADNDVLLHWENSTRIALKNIADAKAKRVGK